MTSALLQHLNRQQQDVVTAGPGAHLVIAGAGTGKTRTLIHRVAWLVESGVDPSRIVLLTFTRRAAAEMVQRAASLIGGPAHRIRGGTFHAFAHRSLRQYAPVLGYRQDFTLLDSADSQAFVGMVRADIIPKVPGRRFPQRKTLQAILSKQVNTGRSLHAILDRDYPQYVDDHDDIARVRDEYTARKRSQGVLDYDDLLVLFADLLAEHPGARQRIGGACEHLLVDEYQDTNPLQAQIALLLANTHGNLMVVGDEAQSIYAFRGADIQNILALPKLWPGCTVLKLEQNYRSSQSILDLANGVLAQARDRYEKHLFSELPPGPQPAVIFLDDDEDEASYVVQQVLQAREEGVPLREQAVLFRSSSHASLLELALAKANIPFRKYGGITFVEASHVKDVLALLRLVANPHDELAWFRALLWTEGLGSKMASSLIERVRSSSPPALDPAWTRGRKIAGGVASLATCLREAQGLIEDLPALLEHLLAWYRPVLARLYDDHLSRRRDLETLQQLAGRAPSLEHFLAEITLDPAGAQPEPEASDDEWLTLSTIHSAKGLEWDRVWIQSAVTGRFPSIYALDDDDSLEEERRLLYVAMTRARRELALLVPSRAGGRHIGSDNMFLNQLPHAPPLVDHRWWRPEPPASEAAPELKAATDRMAQFLAHYRRPQDR